MEKSKRRATSNRGMEENTLAILESFCSLDSSHVHDDRKFLSPQFLPLNSDNLQLQLLI